MPLPTSITARLEHQHKSLFDLIEGLSDVEIRRQIVPGKWSIFENIVHLSTYQHAFLHRINKIASEENPKFPRYTAESDPLFYDNCGKATKLILQDLIVTRNALITEILSLDNDSIHRTGEHPLFGKMNVVQWLNFFLLHEAHHLFTIFKLIPGLHREP